MTIITLDDEAAVDGRLPGRSPELAFRVHHSLSATGLLELDRLAELASFLPTRSVEHNVGSVPALLPGGEAPRLSLTPAEIVRGIETNESWMVLKNVEADAEYRALLAACVADVHALVTAAEGAPVLQEGFIFLSSPGSVTPAHIDPEHNILLQVRGTKTMSIGRFQDPNEMLLQVECLHGGGHRNLSSAPIDLVDYPLSTGEGVYVPVHAPHVVRNGPAVSISLSITWRTPYTLRTGRVHGLNRVLRSKGLPISPPGSHAVRDEIKASLYRAGLAAARRLHRT